MRSALIVGGNSAIGKALRARLEEEGVKTTATYRNATSGNGIALDLEQSPESWPALPAADVAYLCAAMTKLEDCEKNPEGSRQINVLGTQALAKRLMEQGSHVVFLSSNQVFDGTRAYHEADAPVSPRNVYGRHKAETESWLMRQKTPASVLRLTKVISGPLPVIGTWRAQLKAEETVEAFGDLVFAPLPLALAIEGLIRLGQKRHAGIFQLSGVRDISYYDVAVALARRMGRPGKLVEAKSARAIIPSQFLPANGTLHTSEIFADMPCPEPLDVLLPS